MTNTVLGTPDPNAAGAAAGAGGADPNADAAKAAAAAAANADPNKGQGGNDPAKDDKGGAGGQEEPEVFKPYEVALPQGVELDAESVKGFNAVANELKIPQEAAQKLVEWYGKSSTEKAAARSTEWQKLNDGWVASAKSDTEIGGDKFDKSVADARLAITKFGTKEFGEMLNLTGAGNHPETIRFLSRVYNATKEDKMVTGGQAVGAVTSVAKTLFPNQN